MEITMIVSNVSLQLLRPATSSSMDTVILVYFPSSDNLIASQVEVRITRIKTRLVILYKNIFQSLSVLMLSPWRPEVDWVPCDTWHSPLSHRPAPALLTESSVDWQIIILSCRPHPNTCDTNYRSLNRPQSFGIISKIKLFSFKINSFKRFLLRENLCWLVSRRKSNMSWV